jgi:hypothetical protein
MTQSTHFLFTTFFYDGFSCMPLSAKEAAEAQPRRLSSSSQSPPLPPNQEAAIQIQQILASAQQASLMQQASNIPPDLMQQKQALGMNGVQQMYPGTLSPRTGAAGIFGATGPSLTFSPSAPSKFTPSRSQVERGSVVAVML